MNRMPNDVNNIIHRYVREQNVLRLNEELLYKIRVIRFQYDILFGLNDIGASIIFPETRYCVCKKCGGWFLWKRDLLSHLCIDCNGVWSTSFNE